MKKFLFFLTAFLLIASGIFAQAPDFEWAKHAQGQTIADLKIEAVAMDGSGNSYVTGWFQGSATFGSTTLTSSGVYDIFIEKYDAAGNAVWAQKYYFF
jgi:hypothetical protein